MPSEDQKTSLRQFKTLYECCTSLFRVTKASLVNWKVLHDFFVSKVQENMDTIRAEASSKDAEWIFKELETLRVRSEKAEQELTKAWQDFQEKLSEVLESTS